MIQYLQQFSYLLLPTFTEMLEVSIQPKGCICPSQGYTCQAKNSLTLNWYPTCNTTTGDDLTFSVARHGGADIIRECGGFKVNYSSHGADRQFPTIISTLLVTNHSVNGTDFTCEGIFGDRESNDTVPICIIGKIVLIVHLDSIITRSLCDFR